MTVTRKRFYKNLLQICCVFLLAQASHTAWAGCPKILMFDGVDLRTQTNRVQAKYWGKTIGIQGFFLNNIMSDWQVDVGAKPRRKIWQVAKNFESLYSRYGVTDNFIKVAIWHNYNWNDVSEYRRVVRNYSHAAELAKYVGFKGIALDLEPYVVVWGDKAGGPATAAKVQAEGRGMGKAMKAAYPDMTLVLIKDAVYWAHLNEGYHGGYGLAVSFLKGIFSVGFRHVVIAEERNYKNPHISQVILQTRREYAIFSRNNDLPKLMKITIAPGLWPLGRSYTNKSARQTPAQFHRQLKAAFRTGVPYIWIYGYGSAWQANGPYGAGKVVRNFSDYVKAIKDARNSCKR